MDSDILFVYYVHKLKNFSVNQLQTSYYRFLGYDNPHYVFGKQCNPFEVDFETGARPINLFQLKLLIPKRLTKP